MSLLDEARNVATIKINNGVMKGKMLISDETGRYSDIIPGIDGQALVLDAAEPLGVKWETIEGPGGVTNHNTLTGLEVDSHLQYALADGSRGDFATLAQGLVADSAVQPGNNISVLVNDAGYITSNAVLSVNTKTGIVVLDKTDIGLSNVDNTSDADKVISDATQTALDNKSNVGHTHIIANITGLQTELDLKLENINSQSINNLNDVDKTGWVANDVLAFNVSGDLVPVAQSGGGGAVTSVNTQTGAVVLDTDDIDDSTQTNKYTTAGDISKLAGIASGAQVNTVTSVNTQTGAVVLDKTDIGLSNVDNTSDLDKPVSNATSTALTGKSDVGHTHTIANITGLQTELDSKLENINSQSIGDLSDVDLTGATPLDQLQLNGSGDWVPFTPSEPIGGLVTGLISGGIVSINVDPTKVDITAGTGVIIDWSNPLAPVKTDVSWGAMIGVVLTGIASSAFTRLMIDGTGSLIQKINDTDRPHDIRQYVVLETAVHTNLSTISRITTGAIPAYQQSAGILDYIDQVGPVNAGNQFNNAGSDLQLAKDGGTTTIPFINLFTDSQSPSIKSHSAESPVATFSRAYRDGSGGSTFEVSSVINPDNYDDGSGTLQSVPTNRWTIQKIFWFGSADVASVVYGQVLYNSLAAAESALNDPTEISQLIANGAYVTALIVKGGTTDLSSVNAEFVPIVTTGTAGFATGVTDHTLLSNIGVNTHDQIDAHIASINVSSDTVQTTDATQTTLQTVSVGLGERIIVTTRVVGEESATEDSAWRYIRCAVKNVGGTASLVGGVASDSGYDAGASTWDITVNVSGSDLLIQVTGEAAHTIDWKTTTQVS